MSADSDPFQKYVRSSEAARIMGVSAQRVGAMIRQGDLKAVRPWPGATLVARAEIEAYLSREALPAITITELRRELTDRTEEQHVEHIAPELAESIALEFIRERRPRWAPERQGEWAQVKSHHALRGDKK